METLNLIYYSPTGTTQKIIRKIGENLGFKTVLEKNLIENNLKLTIADNSLTVIGVPVYGGRLPLPAIEFVNKIQSNQSPVVIVVVYGNRDYDDSLLELKEIATNCGFKIIAGGAFIGEHSYSSKEKPIAKNRPDKQDVEKCRDFARLITKKIKSNKNLNNLTELDVRGNFPYKERKQLPSSMHPETDHDLCDQCGVCVDLCPTDAISIEDNVITNGELCTWCCACVKNCPNGARTFDNPIIDSIKDNLFLNFSIRKEPEFFV